MVNPKQKPHAILVCYPLQGHVIPTVHLAIKLASSGFTITFINTQSIHHQITSKAQNTEDEDIFSDVRKKELDIRYATVSDGLPLEFDRSLNHDQFMAALLHVFSAHVEEAVRNIVKSGPPVSCLIADTFFVWPGMLAKKYELLYVSFWTEAALVFTLYYHLDLLRLNGHFDCTDRSEKAIDYIPGVESIQPKDLMSFLQDTDTKTVCHQIIYKAFKDARYADFVLCNTVHELEPKIISALQEEIPFFSIGPIFPFGFTKSSVATSLWSESDCTHWLDTKPRGSVLYVSFGSYAHVTKDELTEIAHGLKLSQVSFVWVVRPDIVSSNDVDPLPKDFKADMGDRALIIPWCCQNQVLSHPAIGGFLSHCGWNSVLESIWSEVPILCFPLFTDQFTNRKLVVDDWKVGINLCDQKPITEFQVSENINHLMRGTSANQLRNAIKELKMTLQRALAADGSSEKNMDRFISDFLIAIQKKDDLMAANHSTPLCNGI